MLGENSPETVSSTLPPKSVTSIPSNKVAKSYKESFTYLIHTTKHDIIKKFSKDHHDYKKQFQDGDDKYIPYTSDDLRKKGLVNNINFPTKDLPRRLYNVKTRESVETKDLQDGISYVAVSYVWDHSQDGIDFEGIDWKVKSVSKEALNRILQNVHSLGFEYAWIDVLCMNQSKEKMEEILEELLHMHQYYAHGSACLVFLDKPMKDRQFDLRGLEDIPPWFTRVWTLQEGWIPMQCLYLIDGEGDSARYLTDYHFFHFINSVEAKSKLKEEEKKKLEIALNLIRGSWIPTPLNIKEQINNRTCSKEIDKFYGVLGFISIFASVSANKSLEPWIEKQKLIIGRPEKTLLELDIEYGELITGELLTWWLMCEYLGENENENRYQKKFAWQILKSDCFPPDHSGCVIYTAYTKMEGDKIHLRDVLFAQGNHGESKIDAAIVLALRAVGREWNVIDDSQDYTHFEIEGLEYTANNRVSKTIIRAAVVREYFINDQDEYIVQGKPEWIDFEYLSLFWKDEIILG
ncbi:hypothetical protein HK096_007797 [Nowakowskiella sp. JEL0078]|nr:hypothetical protein HK096_007797 [Nowakowskiella sp. JEL0078]